MHKLVKACLAIALALLNLSCSQLALEKPEYSNIAVARSIEYPWMSLSTWQARHQADIKIAQSADVDLLFLGDSITESWNSGDNLKVFTASFGQYRSANFAIGGDQTQHQLWRLQNGATGNIKPKVTMLMIGINNYNHSGHNAQEVFTGIVAVVKQIKISFPDTIILLHAILPSGSTASNPLREKVSKTNKMLMDWAINEGIYYYDFGEVFISDSGDIPRELMPDALHPSYTGLQVFAEKLKPVIDELMTK